MHSDGTTGRDGWSLGVEEEFLVVDSSSGKTISAAPEVLRAAADRRGAAPDAALHPELLTSQVEAATGRCWSLEELAAQLTHARQVLTTAVPDVRLLASGVPPMGGVPVVSEGDRFSRIAERYAGVGADYQACGCHVHVGVSDMDTAVAVTDHVRPWLATLLAVSANSPWHDGTDTGYASWRMVQQSRFPGAGVPPLLGTEKAHRDLVGRLVDSGVLLDEAMTFWLVRPSYRLPTVEFRVADTAFDIAGAVLQAALSRALVRTALAELACGRTAPDVSDQVLAAGVWSAARYGLDGPGVDPWTGCRRPAVDLFRQLIDAVRPALLETGDRRAVEDLARHVCSRGTGAARQRAAGSATAAVRLLAQTFGGEE
jgi:carboxylate-amine ligase